MCANFSAPPLQMGHPSAHALTNMSTQFQPQGPGQLVPAVGQINGPQRIDPLPFDDRNPAYGNITSSYPVENERERPMANIPTWQTPVLPFSHSADTSPYDLHRSPFQLFTATGVDQDAWRPKREQAPMFTPQPQNTYGMPAQAQVQRDRYQPSNELKHQKPFEAEWSLRQGGFHPTTRILPTNVPVLRQALPTGPVNGAKVSSHPSGLFGENRGELGLVERRGFDTSCYYKVPFPTSSVVQAAPQWAPTIAKPTDRQCTSRPYGGGADATGTGAGASYVKGKYFMEAQRLPSQLHERMQQAGGPQLVDGGASMTRFGDVARTTRAQGTENASMQGAPRPPIPAGAVHPMDIAKPTMLEFTEQQVRPTALNGVSTGPTMQFMDQARPTIGEGTELHVRATALNGVSTGPTMQFMDQARPTVGEGTEQQVRPTALNGVSTGPTMQFMDQARATVGEGTELATAVSGVMGAAMAPMNYLQDPARPTLKQMTSNHDYTGGAGQSELNAPMETGSYQSAHLNEKLEIAMNINRAPTMGDINVTSVNTPRVGYGDPLTVRVRDDFLPNRYGGLCDKTAQGMDRWIPQVTVNDQKAMEESWQNCRNENYVLTGLAQNPYAIPIWSVQQ